MEVTVAECWALALMVEQADELAPLCSEYLELALKMARETGIAPLVARLEKRVGQAKADEHWFEKMFEEMYAEERTADE